MQVHTGSTDGSIEFASPSSGVMTTTFIILQEQISIFRECRKIFIWVKAELLPMKSPPGQNDYTLLQRTGIKSTHVTLRLCEPQRTGVATKDSFYWLIPLCLSFFYLSVYPFIYSFSFILSANTISFFLCPPPPLFMPPSVFAQDSFSLTSVRGVSLWECFFFPFSDRKITRITACA